MLGATCFASVLLASVLGSGMHEQILATVKKTLDFENWPGKDSPVRAFGGVDVGKIASLKGYVVRGTDTDKKLHGLCRNVYLHSDTAKAGLTIRFYVGDSPGAAHEVVANDMTNSSALISSYLSAFKVDKAGLGDFSVVRKDTTDKSAHAPLRFTRGNIAVIVECSTLKVNLLPVAKELDELIQKWPVVSRQEYDATFPKLEIAEVHPTRVKPRQLVTVRLKPHGKLREGLVLESTNPHSRYDAAKGSFSVYPGMAGRNLIAIVLYDPQTLLSRWVFTDVVVVAPPSKGPTPRVRRREVTPADVAAVKKALDFENLPGKDSPVRAFVGVRVPHPETGPRDGQVSRFRVFGGAGARKMASLKGYVYIGTNEEKILGYGLGRVIWLRSAEEKAVLRLRYYVGATPRAAHEMLAAHMTKRAVAETAMAFSTHLSLFKVNKAGLGDFSVLRKAATDKNASTPLRFVRGNVAVSLYCTSQHVNLLPIARELDEVIGESPIVSREEYEATFPKLEIAEVHPTRVKPRQLVTVRLKPHGKLREGLVLESANPYSHYDAAKGSFSLYPVVTGPRQIWIVLYDPRTLLSRWVCTDIVVVAPQHKGPTTRRASRPASTEQTNQAASPDPTAERAGSPRSWLWVAGAGAALLAAVLVCLIVWGRSRRRRRQAEASGRPGGDAQPGASLRGGER